MAVTKTTLRLTAKLRADLLTITNQHDRALTKAWVDAWDLVAGDLELAIARLIIDADEGTVTQAQALRASRLQQALDAVSRALVALIEAAGITITTDLPKVVREAGEAQAAIIGSQVPKDQLDNLAGWDRVDPEQIAAIVKRSTERITSQLWPISAEADAVIRRELVRGIASGSNPRQTAARMIKNAEGGFNGGLTRALVISRTETLDAHRAAAKVSQEANADVLGGWVWLTDLSPRTCPACLGMSGTEHPLSEPGPQGHQQCRCSRMPRTKTWAELGFEDMDEPGPVTPDAGEWFAQQDEKTQRSILGAGRYEAWKRGDYPMDNWAVRKQNPDWRPSYVTSPLAS
ncbi:phage minor head protein [Kribbella qitaiheensis]|uniref:phage minor head protein n=1 Tax=Kribbella qitaiheensis TaxID=1544730 RepID=UPI00360DE835